MPTPPRLLAFAGSARRDSLNKKLLANVVDAARAAGAEVTVLDLNDLPMPLYHGDLEDEQGLPDNALKFIALLGQHQGLLIASPEYNSQMTPLLKNTLDWSTRGDENPYKGKVAAVVSASPGQLGGVRSMTLARQLLVHLGCIVVPAQCILPAADEAFDEQGKLKEERARKNARSVATELIRLAHELA